MPTTPSGLPYPALTDTPDVPYWMQQLADAVEARGVWQAYTPTLAGTGWALGNGTLTGRYCRAGKTVFARLRLTIGSTTTKGTGQLTLGTPSVSKAGAYHTAPVVVHDISPAGWSFGVGLLLESSATVACFQPAGSAITGTSPITLATGDEIAFSMMYEEA
jgi:hypothetical protein